MAMFKAVAAEHLKVLFFMFGSDFYYGLRTNDSCLVLESYAAAVLHLAVWMLVTTAQAGAVNEARAAASARGEAFDVDKEATAAIARGIASVPAGWKRQSLRGLLLVAVHLSGVGYYHAIVTFQDGFLYSAGSPFYYILICLMAVVHNFSAWVAMWQN